MIICGQIIMQWQPSNNVGATLAVAQNNGQGVGAVREPPLH